MYKIQTKELHERDQCTSGVDSNSNWF